MSGVYDQDVDMWVLRIVVREGRYMQLNRTEEVLAAHLMREKGLTRLDMSLILRVTEDLVDKFLRLKPVMPIDEVDPTVIGARITELPSFSRKELAPPTDRKPRRRKPVPVS